MLKENEELKTKLDETTKKLQSLIKKVDEYKINCDRYKVVCQLIDDQRAQGSAPDQMTLTDSTVMVCVDLAVPTVEINMAQKRTLDNITEPGAAARTLLDMLFLWEQLDGMNATKLKKDHPEKIKAILAYVTSRFPKCPESKITKAITNKCGGF